MKKKAIDGIEIIKKSAKMFNKYFSKFVKNLKIPEYSNIDQLSEHIRDPFMKAIVKYKQHSSIAAIKQRFSFSFVEKKGS